MDGRRAKFRSYFPAPRRFGSKYAGRFASSHLTVVVRWAHQLGSKPIHSWWSRREVAWLMRHLLLPVEASQSHPRDNRMCPPSSLRRTNSAAWQYMGRTRLPLPPSGRSNPRWSARSWRIRHAWSHALQMTGQVSGISPSRAQSCPKLIHRMSPGFCTAAWSGAISWTATALSQHCVTGRASGNRLAQGCHAGRTCTAAALAVCHDDKVVMRQPD